MVKNKCKQPKAGGSLDISLRDAVERRRHYHYIEMIKFLVGMNFKFSCFGYDV